MTRFAIPESVTLLRSRTSFIPVPALLAKLRGITRREALDVARAMTQIAREVRLYSEDEFASVDRCDAARYLRYAAEYRRLASEL
jgi:hypothetical protein